MIGIHRSVVPKYVRKYQEILLSNIEEEDKAIEGEGIQVQVNESQFGKRKYHRGHRVDGAWVIRGVEIITERKVFF